MTDATTTSTDTTDLDELELCTTRSTRGGWWVSDKTAPSGGILIRAEDVGGLQFTIMDIAVRENSWDVTEMLLAHSALPTLIAELRLLRRVASATQKRYPTEDGSFCCVCRVRESYADGQVDASSHAPDCPLAAYKAWRAQQAQGKQ